MESLKTVRRRSKKPTTYHHQGRALALQVLYEVDLTGHDWKASLIAHAGSEEVSPRVEGFAEEAIAGVVASKERVDALMQRHAPMWPIEQLSAVDRSILRLALYELLPGSTVPAKVTINEAVELAKEYGGETSARFVNGVLGSALEELADTSNHKD